jgi:hypothetical protein
VLEQYRAKAYAISEAEAKKAAAAKDTKTPAASKDSKDAKSGGGAAKAATDSKSKPAAASSSSASSAAKSKSAAPVNPEDDWKAKAWQRYVDSVEYYTQALDVLGDREPFLRATILSNRAMAQIELGTAPPPTLTPEEQREGRRGRG